MEAVKSHCPLCASIRVWAFKVVPNDVPGAAAVLPLNECLDCGLAWQFPRNRSFSESVKHHTSKYSEQQSNSYFDPTKRIAIAVTELNFLGECVDQPGTLLDVGAGDGTFISVAAEHGWSCTGIDPAGTTSDFSLHPNGGKSRLIRGTMNDLSMDGKFDVITMWDVIEHLEDPEPIIEATTGLLQDDGILVLETGNFQSADRIVSGDRWWGYAEDHRWYFSPLNLRRLLNRAGYRFVYYSTRTLRPWWKGTHFYDGPSRVRTFRGIIRSPFSALSQLKIHKALADAAVAYRNWAGLGIVTVVASMKPLQYQAGENTFIEI